MPIPRDAIQTLITKLDLNYISLKEAKSHAWNTYRVEIKGRTKAQAAKELGELLKP